MTFPTLDGFEAMIQPLHQAVMLFAPIKRALFPKRNNYLHLATDVLPRGLTTGQLPNGGELVLDFEHGAYVYTASDGSSTPFALAAHTQASLLRALLTTLRDDNLAAQITDAVLDNDEMTGDTSLAHDISLAADYAEVQNRVYTAIARWRGKVEGHMTPIVIWAEHFDLSTLWFVDPAMDDSQAHINIGFAPYTPDLTPRPYLYAYAYPDDFTPPSVPSPAFFNTDGFKGVIAHYDDLAALDDPDMAIESLCDEIFAALKTTLR